MAVDDYVFGRITIEGQVYTKDVLLLPRGVHSPWWRKEGHNLDPVDLQAVFEDPPDTLVIGTGFYGNMDVPEKTLKALRDNGIEPRVARTAQAVEELNRLMQTSSRIAAALHLTC